LSPISLHSPPFPSIPSPLFYPYPDETIVNLRILMNSTEHAPPIQLAKGYSNYEFFGKQLQRNKQHTEKASNGGENPLQRGRKHWMPVAKHCWCILVQRGVPTKKFIHISR
jgi:hypothetical protein